MASVQKRNNGTYQISVFRGRDLSGHKITESATFAPDPVWSERKTERELQKFVIAFEQRVKDGTSRGDVLTFEKYACQWLDTYIRQECKPTTVAAYERALDKWLLPRCGFMKLSDVTPMIIQGIINDMRRTGYSYTTKNGNIRKGSYSEETLKDARRTLSAILGSAYSDGLIASNPATRTRARKKGKAQEQRLNVWSAEQAQRFLDAIQKPLPVVVGEKTHHRNGKEVKVSAYTMKSVLLPTKSVTLFFLALYSGCRKGELLGLTWSDVDFTNATITIRSNAQYVSSVGSYTDTPKTAAGRRTIILPAVCMSMLKRWKKEQAQEIFALGSAWIGDRTQKNTWVFTTENGDRMAYGTPTSAFRKAIRLVNNGLSEENKLPMIRLHDCRHTCASLLIASGLDPVSVAHRLGHSDAVITLRTYSHAFKEMDTAAANALETALTGSRQATG